MWFLCALILPYCMPSCGQQIYSRQPIILIPALQQHKATSPLTDDPSKRLCPLLIREPQGGLQPFKRWRQGCLSNGNERLQATPAGESASGQAVFYSGIRLGLVFHYFTSSEVLLAISILNFSSGIPSSFVVYKT